MKRQSVERSWKIEAMKHLKLHRHAFSHYYFTSTTQYESEPIWFHQPYLISNLFDSDPTWFRNYLVRTYLIPYLSDSKRIWVRTYLFPNLSDSAPVWFQTYRISNQCDYESLWFQTFLNLDQSGPIWVRTNLIPNLSEFEPIWLRNLVSASEPIWFRTHLILNLSDIEPEACPNPLPHPSAPFSLQSWDVRRPLLAPCGKISNKIGQLMFRLPFPAHMAANPSLGALWRNWGPNRSTWVPSTPPSSPLPGVIWGREVQYLINSISNKFGTY
jgi:hypothetical protein